MVSTVHIIGSSGSGGAERFYARLCLALHGGGERVSAINQPGSAVAGLLAGRVEQRAVRMRNNWDVFAIIQIRQFLRQIQPQVVQTYMGRATRLVRYLSSEVVHVARLGGLYGVRGYRHADAWVGNTKGICNYLIASGFRHERVFHIGNFILPEQCKRSRVDIRQELGVDPDTLMIFSAGRFIERKGYTDLIAALARLPSEVAGRRWCCVIAGGGPQEMELKALVRECGLQEQILWTGWLNALGDYYRAADLFVCPSRWEPLGNVILEAWQYRLPVVSTATEGALELITDGQNALLCPPEDPISLSHHITRVLQMTSLEYRELAEEGYGKLLAEYSPERITNQYLEMYQFLITNRKSSASP